jgi:hypothetical protein
VVFRIITRALLRGQQRYRRYPKRDKRTNSEHARLLALRKRLREDRGRNPRKRRFANGDLQHNRGGYDKALGVPRATKRAAQKKTPLNQRSNDTQSDARSLFSWVASAFETGVSGLLYAVSSTV